MTTKCIIYSANFRCLAQTAELCKQQGASSVECHVADVSKKENIEALVKTILDAHSLDILVNNAGTAESLRDRRHMCGR